MNLRRTLHNHNKKGYTLLELLVTLFIFALITMYGVPAFYHFIEESRAKTQLIRAAGFLRSAQEIATSSNRAVYVFTDGYFNYTDHVNDYWYQDWIMSFKPIGGANRSITDQDVSLKIVGADAPNPNYLISKQTIFTENGRYKLYVLDSSEHNAVDRKNLGGSDDLIEMEGYSKVRDDNVQGSTDDKPTYIVFYPSGAVVMPVFVLAEDDEFTDTDTSFSSSNNWASIRAKLEHPVAILAGCRMGRGLTIDAISYTFNQALINNNDIFEKENRTGTSGSAPSFGPKFCGSKSLQ